MALSDSLVTEQEANLGLAFLFFSAILMMRITSRPILIILSLEILTTVMVNKVFCFVLKTGLFLPNRIR